MDHRRSIEGPQLASPGNVSDPSSRPGPIRIIPDHELLRCVGRGSYGEVWLARSMLGLYRAVKIVDRSSFKDEKPFERELSGIRRFEPISRSHEGFIDILHVGIDEAKGFFYYVMELGDDENSGQQIDLPHYSPKTLAKEIFRRGKLPSQECLELGIALSHALSELHKHGLVHRDVKPSNIIFVNGVPKLADIGLVADVNDARSYVGTEGFIPPEGPGTPQADIFGLGKVLYEASTGKDRQDFPELPTVWDQFSEPERMAELNEVILQACKNDPKKRYLSAWDLHADLLVVANGKSLKRLKTLERRLSRAKRAVAISFTGLLAAVVLCYPIYREHKAVTQAKEQQVGADIAYGNGALDSGDLLGSLPYFASAFRLDVDDEVRAPDHRLRLGSVLAQCPKLVQMWAQPREIEQAELSADGHHVLIAEWYGQAQVFDVSSGQAVSPRFGQPSGMLQSVFSPDGSHVITSGEDNTACVWASAGGSAALRLPHPMPVLAAAYSPDSRRIITGCRDGIARLWDAESGELTLTLRGHKDAILCAAFSKDGSLIVTTSRDATARIWNAATGAPLGAPLLHPSWVRTGAFSPDTRSLLTACSDHRARVWDVETRKPILPDLIHHDEVRSAEYSPDGRLLLTASLDHTVGLWLAGTHQPLNPNPVLRHSDRVTDARFSKDGHRIVTACTDGTVRIWDLAGSATTARIMHNHFSPDGLRFLSATDDKAQVCDTVSGQPVSPWMQLGSPLPETWLSSDGRFLVSVSADGHPPDANLQVWDTQSGTRQSPRLSLAFQPQSILLSSNGVLAVLGQGRVQSWVATAGEWRPDKPIQATNVEGGALSPDGGFFAGWSETKVHLWDLRNGRELFRPFDLSFPVKHVEFSPDGSRLVGCGADVGFSKCHAQAWEVSTGQPLGTELNHGDGVLCASFSPDSQLIATASEDFSALVWEAKSGRQLTAPMRHENQTWTAAFSPDSKWLVTASSDQTARVWSAQTGDPLTPSLRHSLPLRSARFLGNNSRLIVHDRTGDAWLWTLTPDQKSPEELVSLSRLLTGDMINPSTVSRASTSRSPREAWQALRDKYPADFIAPPSQIAAWHELQAQQSEGEKDWFAAAFHLEQLLALQPGDAALKSRLNTARAYLPRP